MRNIVKSISRIRCISLVIILTVIGCSKQSGTTSLTDSAGNTIKSNAANNEPRNVIFTAAAADPFRVPTIRRLDPPWPTGCSAVWGSMGRDRDGIIYIGASCESSKTASAHLLAYNPAADAWTDRGGAVEQLKRLKIDKPGETQNKIHSKIWHAPNGDLYFASMDETGELDDGTVLPIYGSHLWRLKPGGSDWVHLKAVPEGIVASTLGGSSVYFLGYFGHVLYRVDTDTGTITQTLVGATGGHVSRNLFADRRGHVFVPRVRSGQASLVELDPNLDVVNTTELTDYDVSPNADSHGITAVTPLKDGSMCFLTDGGRLYRVSDGTVTDLGRIHPAGLAYVSCLISPDGERWLNAIGHRPTKGEPVYEWIVHDLKEKKTTVTPITIPVSVPDAKSVLVYGSMTRDDAGRWYVGGAYRSGPRSGDFTAAIWQISW
ncbi:MAG: hypothetical protein U0798_02125 [Gemmataceae bacterium]